jgi:putative transposase
MACFLGVSQSGYYDFVKRRPCQRTLDNEALVRKIKTLFQESRETYGSPRIHADLLEQGFSHSGQKVARLMKQEGLQAKMYRQFVKTTKRSKCPLFSTQDLVQRTFQASHPNQLWVADISFIPINQRWGYLAIILDLFSRKVVGMSLKDTLKTSLIPEALRQALFTRCPPQGLIHH